MQPTIVMIKKIENIIAGIMIADFKAMFFIIFKILDSYFYTVKLVGNTVFTIYFW